METVLDTLANVVLIVVLLSIAVDSVLVSRVVLGAMVVVVVVLEMVVLRTEVMKSCGSEVWLRVGGRRVEVRVALRGPQGSSTMGPSHESRR